MKNLFLNFRLNCLLFFLFFFIFSSDDKAELDIAVNMRFGYSIPKVSAKVQEKVSQAINNMTGLEVTKVNVRIAGIASPDKE